MTNRWWPSRGTLDSGSTSAASITRQRSSGGHMDGEETEAYTSDAKAKTCCGDATGTFWMYIKSSRTTCTGTSYDSFFRLTDVILSQLCILPHQDASLGARCVFDMSLLNPDEKKQQNDTEESCSWIRCFFLFFFVSFGLFAVFLHPFLPRDISPVSRHHMKKKNPKPWSKNLKLRCWQVHNWVFTG